MYPVVSQGRFQAIIQMNKPRGRLSKWIKLYRGKVSVLALLYILSYLVFWWRYIFLLYIYVCMYVSVYVYIRSYVDEKTQQWTEVTLYKVIMTCLIWKTKSKNKYDLLLQYFIVCLHFRSPKINTNYKSLILKSDKLSMLFKLFYNFKDKIKPWHQTFYSEVYLKKFEFVFTIYTFQNAIKFLNIFYTKNNS